MNTDLIFRFIHALNQGELRSCRNELELDSIEVGKFRLLLFETLAAQPSRDWDALKLSVSVHRTRAQLLVEKTQLLELLMAILASVRRKKERKCAVLLD